MSRTLPSFLGSQQFVGGLFGLVALVHFGLWTGRPENPLRASLRRGDLATVPVALLDYLGDHPAYVLLFVVGVAAVVRSTRT